MYSPLLVKNVIIFAGPLFVGLFVFLILHSLFIGERISVPAALIISILTYGLVRYYCSPSTAIKIRKVRTFFRITDYLDRELRELEDDAELDCVSKVEKSNIIPVVLMYFFVLLYVCSLVIVAIAPHTQELLIIPWHQVSPLQVLQFAAALMVTTFAPGYVVISLLTPKMQAAGKFVLSVTTSIFITGLVTYIGVSIGLDFSTVTNQLILIYFLFWVVSAVRYLKMTSKELKSDLKYCGFLIPFSWLILRGLYNKWMTVIKQKSSEIIVFASLFGLIVISTYYLYGGVIIGDQWFHHGQALSFLSNTFRSEANSNEILNYPKLLHAYLAGFFNLSGLPSVNSYAAISFLNILPVFAFYYFFSNWVPGYAKKTAILGTAIFMLSAGFGWLYVVYLSHNDQLSTEAASLDIFNDARIKSFDIFQPSSFIGVDHPGITSPLIVISLPVGLAMLGLIADPSVQRGLRLMVIISLISLAGILSHPEFFIFVIVGSLAALIFDLTWKKSIFIAFIISIATTLVIDMLPGHSYTAKGFGGIPLIYISLVIVVLTFFLSYFKTVVKNISSKNSLPLHLTRISRKYYADRTRFLFALVLISLFVYFYFLSFLIWGDLSLETVQKQTSKAGQQIIPWYLYPIKLGVCGFIGPLFIIYCLFKKSDKRLFIFFIILIIALFLGPYYDEHRFSKYMMVGLVGFSALFFSSIITRILNSGSKVLRDPNTKGICISILIGLVIVSVSMSVILYTGYSALAIKDHYLPFLSDLPKRYFPSTSEMTLLQLIYKDISTGGNYNVVLPSTEYAIRQGGFAGKLEAFTGIPTIKILKGQQVLDASSLQEFNSLLNVTNTKYIILPKYYIKNDLNFTNIKREAGSDQNSSFQPARFALENFETFYEDKDYLVLSVPYTPFFTNGSEIVLSVPYTPFFTNGSENVQKKENRDTENLYSLREFIKVPGDVSEAAKAEGIEIPWQQAMISYKGLGLIISILLVAFFVGYRFLPSPGALKDHKR